MIWEVSDGFLITDVSHESGQSVFEFLLILPLMLGLTLVLLKMNTAIQISIVNQQYARAQALFLTYSSPFYPTLSKQERLISTATHQLIVGVMDNAIDNDKALITPRATVQRVTRKTTSLGSNLPKEEPSERAWVRIRNTVTLCTQTLFLQTSRGVAPILRVSSDFLTGLGTSSFDESSDLSNFCVSKMKYEQ